MNKEKSEQCTHCHNIQKHRFYHGFQLWDLMDEMKKQASLPLDKVLSVNTSCSPNLGCC